MQIRSCRNVGKKSTSVCTAGVVCQSVRHDVEAVGAQITLHSTRSRLACLVENRPVRCSRHAAPVASDTVLEYATRTSIALAAGCCQRRGTISTPPPLLFVAKCRLTFSCSGRSFAPCLEFRLQVQSRSLPFTSPWSPRSRRSRAHTEESVRLHPMSRVPNPCTAIL